MHFSQEETLAIAKLAQLELAPEEIEALSGQLARIVEYVEQLREVPTGGIPPTAHPLIEKTPLREDQPKNFPFDRKLMQSQAPRFEEDFYIVPRVVE